MRELTFEEWSKEGREKFGDDMMNWKFVCPSCGHVAKAADWYSAGARSGAVAFSCVGRYIDGSKEAFRNDGPGPCNYAGGGLFKLNPVRVRYTNDGGEPQSIDMFEFYGGDGAKDAA